MKGIKKFLGPAMPSLLMLGLTITAFGDLQDYIRVKRHSILTHNFIRLDEQERDLASNEQNISILYYPLNDSNYNNIKGTWKIYNFIAADGTDEKMNVNVELELVGNSKVMIDSDVEQVFHISLITEEKTIAIFKKVEGGIEILEARKINSNIKEERKNTKSDVFASLELNDSESSHNPKGVMLTDNADLILERAYNANISKSIMIDESVSGHLKIVDGKISSFQIAIARGTDHEQALEFDDVEIKDGGAFDAEVSGEVISGIVSNYGVNNFRIRLATGSLAGTMLNFVGEEELQKLQEAKNNTIGKKRNNNEENISNEEEKEKVETQLKEEEKERSAEASATETMDNSVKQEGSEEQETKDPSSEERPAEQVSPEQMEQQLSQSGFNFEQQAPQRILASLPQQKSLAK